MGGHEGSRGKKAGPMCGRGKGPVTALGWGPGSGLPLRKVTLEPQCGGVLARQQGQKGWRGRGREKPE